MLDPQGSRPIVKSYPVETVNAMLTFLLDVPYRWAKPLVDALEKPLADTPESADGAENLSIKGEDS